jgi:hypothetical protein
VTASFCISCGSKLPQGAGYCPTCGSRIAAESAQRPEAEDGSSHERSEPRSGLWLAVVAGATLVLIAVAAYVYHDRTKQRDVALSQARSTYNGLSSRLNTLRSTQIAIATATVDVDSKAVQYFTDEKSAFDAGQKRHDESLAENDTIKMHDLAQEELSLVNDAQTQQAAIEADDSKLLGYYGSLYGDQAIRQFRTDLASKNEAKDNSIAEWQRSIGLVNDNITDSLHFRYGVNSNSDIVAHYTESTRDSNEAVRYQKLCDADALALQARVSADIGSVNSRLALIKTQYPDLVSQKSR